MQRIIETAPIIEVLRQADTKIEAWELFSGYQGVAIETTNGIEFEGTVLYFPGVQLSALKGS